MAKSDTNWSVDSEISYITKFPVFVFTAGKHLLEPTDPELNTELTRGDLI
jgi:hypothetical protein